MNPDNPNLSWTDPRFAWPAPAKLNLFLHITGRRQDGYHLLQTVFQFIDFCDFLYFEPLADGDIRRDSELVGVAAEDDLVVRAARALQQRAGVSEGVAIRVDKRLPMGGGLGGGSSDAATTLVALNRLWRAGLSLDELAAIGLDLGADVPVFVHGHAAWAEGVGESLTPVSPPEPWYLLLIPPVHVDTGEIFRAGELTRDKQPITIRDFLQVPTENVCEKVVAARYPAVAQALAWLAKWAPARMTGTGACVFAPFDSLEAARTALAQLPAGWRAEIAQGLNISPLYRALGEER